MTIHKYIKSSNEWRITTHFRVPGIKENAVSPALMGTAPAQVVLTSFPSPLGREKVLLFIPRPTAWASTEGSSVCGPKPYYLPRSHIIHHSVSMSSTDLSISLGNTSKFLSLWGKKWPWKTYFWYWRCISSLQRDHSYCETNLPTAQLIKHLDSDRTACHSLLIILCEIQWASKTDFFPL